MTEGKKANTQAGIISQFEEVFGGEIKLESSFSDFVYQIQQNEPTNEFALKYLNDAKLFYEKVDAFHSKSVVDES